MQPDPRNTLDPQYAQGLNCPICGHDSLAVRHIDRYPDYVACTNCDSAFVVEEGGERVMYGNIPASYPQTRRFALQQWAWPEAVARKAIAERPATDAAPVEPPERPMPPRDIAPEPAEMPSEPGAAAHAGEDEIAAVPIPPAEDEEETPFPTGSPLDLAPGEPEGAQPVESETPSSELESPTPEAVEPWEETFDWEAEAPESAPEGEDIWGTLHAEQSDADLSPAQDEAEAAASPEEADFWLRSEEAPAEPSEWEAGTEADEEAPWLISDEVGSEAGDWEVEADSPQPAEGVEEDIWSLSGEPEAESFPWEETLEGAPPDSGEADAEAQQQAGLEWLREQAEAGEQAQAPEDAFGESEWPSVEAEAEDQPPDPMADQVPEPPEWMRAEPAGQPQEGTPPFERLETTPDEDQDQAAEAPEEFWQLEEEEESAATALEAGDTEFDPSASDERETLAFEGFELEGGEGEDDDYPDWLRDTAQTEEELPSVGPPQAGAEPPEPFDFSLEADKVEAEAEVEPSEDVEKQELAEMYWTGAVQQKPAAQEAPAAPAPAAPEVAGEDPDAGVIEPEPGHRFRVVLKGSNARFPKDVCAHDLRSPTSDRMTVPAAVIRGAGIGQRQVVNFQVPVCAQCHRRAQARSEEEQTARMQALLVGLLAGLSLVVCALAFGITDFEDSPLTDALALGVLFALGTLIPGVLLLLRATRYSKPEDAQYVSTTLRVPTDTEALETAFEWRNQAYAQRFLDANKELAVSGVMKVRERPAI